MLLLEKKGYCFFLIVVLFLGAYFYTPYICNAHTITKHPKGDILLLGSDWLFKFGTEGFCNCSKELCVELGSF